MDILFTQSVRIKDQVYKAGQTYTLPESVLQDPLFIKFVRAGYAVEADAKKIITLETPQERAKRLAEKLAVTYKAAAAAKASEEPKVESLPVPTKSSKGSK